MVYRNSRGRRRGMRRGAPAAGALLTLTVLLVACTTTPPSPTSTIGGTSSTVEGGAATTTTSGGLLPEADVSRQLAPLAGLEFADFLEASYELLILRDPEFVTELGIADALGIGNGRLNDFSLEFTAETQALEKGILDQLRRFDRNSLTPEEGLSYDVYEWYLDHEVRGHAFTFHDYPVHHFIGSYNDELIRLLTEIHPLDTVEDAEDYVSRLSEISRQVDQLIERLEVSESMGIIQPDFVLTEAIGRLRGEIGGADRLAPQFLPLYQSLAERLPTVAGLSNQRRAEILAAAAAAIEESFIVAWNRLIEHLEAALPLASPEPGLARLPSGDTYYAYLLHGHTSTPLTAEEIHEIGLREVERVTGEVLAAGTAAGYPSTAGVGDILRRAAEDSGFFNGASAAGEAEILAYYDQLFGTVESRMDPVFGRAPEADFIVVPEPIGGGGFYVPASVDGSRPGAFHAGTGGRVPRYILPTVAYHEAVPGHHYQIALAQELDLPSLRRFIQHNGYVEGWALYAERLAHDMGLYADDPHGNIGRLELELLRAVRLVADTGIHALGWSRDEARDYLTSVLGVPRWNHEVERYVVLPGQATGYMIGLLEILDLREAADQTLGDAFDLSAFHDAVLGHGSLPLEILRPTVERELLAP